MVNGRMDTAGNYKCMSDVSTKIQIMIGYMAKWNVFGYIREWLKS